MRWHLPEMNQQFILIKVQGYVSQRVIDNSGLAVSVSNQDGRIVITLTGKIVDQAALMGILNYLYDLGYTVLAIEYQSSP